MSYVTAHSRCRVCEAHELASVIHLGDHALSGQFVGPDDPTPPTAPVHVVRCRACGLTQLEHSVDPALMFNDAYGYRSSVTSTMVAHLTNIAEEASAMLSGRQGPVCTAARVLSVGENDGTLLNAIPLPTGVRVAVDPSGVETDARYPGIRRIKGFFPKDLLLTQKYDLLFMVACFYDARRPVEWANAARALLAPHGLWVVEVADKASNLRSAAFDYWVSEHETLLSAQDMANVAERAKLKIVRAVASTSNGGSCRYYLTHTDSAAYDGHPEWAETLSKMLAVGRDLATNEEPYVRFASESRRLASDLVCAVLGTQAEGDKVCLLGASTKAGSVLQFAGLGKGQIAFAADRDPRKVGKLMPGTGIPVVSEEEARAAKPWLWVTTLPFRGEILARERAAGTTGEVIFFPSMDRVAL